MEIGRKTVPVDLQIVNIGQFDQWISTKFFGRKIENSDNYLSIELIDFIALQARFFEDKSDYNAFKHGCRIGPEAPKMQVKDRRTGEWKSLLALENGVAWFSWAKNRRTGEQSIKFGATECDIDDDHNSILIMALLVRAIRAARLSSAGEKVTFQLPLNLTTKKSQPNRFTITLNFAL
jgi:hypothetical protein